MKIVLLKSIPNLGDSGKILEVKDGYARHLISLKNAAIATQGEIQKSENRRSSEKYAQMVDEKESKKIFDIINGKTIDIEIKGGDNGKLHESVTTSKIGKCIFEKFSIDIPKNKIKVQNEENRIHSFGMHEISVCLFKNITARMNVNVIQENI